MPTLAAHVDRPLSLDLRSDPWLWGGSLTLVVLTTLASGLYPAIALTRVGPSEALQGGGSGMGGQSRSQQVLVTLQFAPAIVLNAGTTVV